MIITDYETALKRANNVIDNLRALNINSPSLVHEIGIKTSLIVNQINNFESNLYDKKDKGRLHSLLLRIHDAELWLEALAYKL